MPKPNEIISSIKAVAQHDAEVPENSDVIEPDKLNINDGLGQPPSPSHLQGAYAEDTAKDLYQERSLVRETHRILVDNLGKELLHIRENREYYTLELYNLVKLWLTFIAFILLFSGFGILNFKLSDGVLIALLGTGAANIIGIFVIVIRWLYHSHIIDKMITSTNEHKKTI